MKKLALIALLAAFTTSTSFAQDATPSTTSDGSSKTPSLRMGLSVSPVISWFNIDVDQQYVETDGVRFNIQYGLHIDKRLGSNPNYFLSTGVFVLNSGGTLKYGHVESTETGDVKSVRTSDFRFNYINIPVTLMLRTNQIGYMTYFARVGFDNGFNIKASQDLTEQLVATGVTSTYEKEDAEDLVTLYRAGLHIELGVEYNFSGNSRLMISGEWNNGLNNVFNKDFKAASISGGPTSLEEKRVKGTSNAFMLKVGVYF